MVTTHFFCFFIRSLFSFSFSFLSVQATNLKPQPKGVEVFEAFEKSFLSTSFISGKFYDAGSDLSKDSFDEADCARSSDSVEEGSRLKADIFPPPQDYSLYSQESSSSEMPLEIFRFASSSEGRSNSYSYEYSDFSSQLPRGLSSSESDSVDEENYQEVIDEMNRREIERWGRG